MGEFEPENDRSDVPELADRDDAVRFLRRNDVRLPEGLTVEKIESRGRWWAVDETSFSFRMERHPSGPFGSMSAGGSGTPTPARWHVRKRYSYDLTTGEWDVTEQMRAFDFSPGLLIDAEYDREPRKRVWEQALARAVEADDPQAVLEEELAATEQRYRSGFEEVPEDHIDEMLEVLEAEFRRRAGMD